MRNSTFVNNLVLIKSSTDNAEPSLAQPNIDIADPNLTKERTLMEEPMLAKSRTLMPDASCAMPYNERELPART